MSSKRIASTKARLSFMYDLISTLTPNGFDGLYERDIQDIEWTNGYELPELASLGGETPVKPVSKVATPIKNNISNEEQLLALANKLGSMKNISDIGNKATNISEGGFTELESEIKACKKCELYQHNRGSVIAEGNSNAKLMFIADSVGQDDVIAGRVLANQGAEHFDKILNAAGIKKDEIYICNILKCSTLAGVEPSATDLSICAEYVKRQVKLVRPKLIACLGNIAVKFVIGPKTSSLSRVHGRWHNSIFNIPAMPLFHPAELVKDSSRDVGSPNWAMWQDIKALKKKYDEIK